MQGLRNVNAKPSRPVKEGEIIQVRKNSILYTYKVKADIGKRVGARLVPEYAENLTPQSELEKLRAPVETFFLKRDRGLGRPTKKDRRTMEDAWDQIDFNNEIEDIPDDILQHFGLTEDDI